ELFREGRFNQDGTFTLTFADLGTWTFFAFDGSPLAGKVKTIADRNGNTLGFDYDGLGRLTLVVDTLGREIQIACDMAGNISSLTDFLGRQVVYDYYDPLEPGGSPGDLKSARSPIVVGTPNGNDFPAGKTTVYTYSRGFADERLNHNLLTVTDPKGQTWLVNEYAATPDPRDLAFDRLVRQTRGDAGDVIDLAYTLAFPPQPVHPPNPLRPGVLAIVNDRVGNVSDFLFDERGRCVRLREFTGRANPDMPTTATLNRPQNRLRAGDPPVFETFWRHNEDSLVTAVVHPNGNETRHVYELELDPQAPWRSRGNLRELHRLPGTHQPVGNQNAIVETFEYHMGFGGCC
ncbi:MAG: hypothetical protein L0206_03785, partial [Actinobacteria bacterium]|nr:hypothetical protein [Actinomycetota bacterium]